jgi:hypothetical protein
MPSTNKPFGLRPIFHPSGIIRPKVLAGGIASAYGSDLKKGQAVKLDTSGTLVKAAAGDAFLGAFAGVEWTDTTGRRRVSNYWPSGTTYQAGSCLATFYDDPEIVYEIQADGVLAQTSIGDQADISNPDDGSTVTGLSQATLSTTLATAGSTKQLRIVDIGKQIDNAWGDAYTVVQVMIVESQYKAVVVAV